MSIPLDHMPAPLREKVQYLTILTKHRKLDKLRELRATSNDIGIEIYHHAAGTDSYFCDKDKRYLTWSQLVQTSKEIIDQGANLFTAVIEYKRGVHFTSSATSPDPRLN